MENQESMSSKYLDKAAKFMKIGVKQDTRRGQRSTGDPKRNRTLRECLALAP